MTPWKTLAFFALTVALVTGVPKAQAQISINVGVRLFALMVILNMLHTTAPLMATMGRIGSWAEPLSEPVPGSPRPPRLLRPRR